MKINTYDFMLAHGLGKAVFSLEHGVSSLVLIRRYCVTNCPKGWWCLCCPAVSACLTGQHLLLSLVSLGDTHPGGLTLRHVSL